MRILRWLMLVVAVTGLVVFSYNVVPQYMQRNTIHGVGDDVFIQTINDTISPTNTHFVADNISVKDILYINDEVAVVNLHTNKEGAALYAVFELRDGKLYLTNYSSSHFTASDFAVSSDITDRIINTVNGL
ncbi:MAG: hypothetical protein ABIP74_00020 [Candidatus Saccharimonas sp.]